MKYSFVNDYSEGAHPNILKSLQKSNLEQHKGYGFDIYSDEVRELISKAIGQPQAAFHFGITGTQANLVCLSAILKPIEGVICPDTGHIAVNEAGAIEATGHKVITAASIDGKLTVNSINDVLKKFTFKPHVVQPKVLYISNTTELGTVYSRKELVELKKFCKENDMYLFIDGARLGAALASEHQDMDLSDIAQYADMFWLGGTKMGAMFGEVIIIPNHSLDENFTLHQKQHGALLAKSSILAQQFTTLLKDNLYLDLCSHANKMASMIGDAFLEKGFELVVEVQSNQVFVILDDKSIERLQDNFDFYIWDKLETGSVCRFVTSWATLEHKVTELVKLIYSLTM